MKKHLFGILVLIITFGIGFWFSPIRFSSFAFGSGLHGGFTAFESTDFAKVTLTRELYENATEANKSFNKHKKEYEEIIFEGQLIESINRKVLVSADTRVFTFNTTKSNDEFFCSIRKDETWIFEICSKSEWHVLEFERQYFLQ